MALARYAAISLTRHRHAGSLPPATKTGAGAARCSTPSPTLRGS